MICGNGARLVRASRTEQAVLEAPEARKVRSSHCLRLSLTLLGRLDKVMAKRGKSNATPGSPKSPSQATSSWTVFAADRRLRMYLKREEKGFTWLLVYLTRVFF